MLEIEGHAIVSADGMIAGADGLMPPRLRNDSDWRQYQAALDRAAIVVVGRLGHERYPNPGRRRLVVTHSVDGLAPVPGEPLATYWNPAGAALDSALAALGITEGTVAVAGVFDILADSFTRFSLSEQHRFVIPDGIPCFAAGHPRQILARLGLRPTGVVVLDEEPFVTSTLWVRER